MQITTATTKLLKLKKRIRAIAGGTSASKTFSILMILIDYSQSHDNKKIDVMSESYPHLEGGSIADFKKIMIEQCYWKDERWNETKHFYTFETGSIMQFISIDQIGKAHGPRRDVLFINECNNIPYSIYEQLEVRTKEIIWLDWNPSVEFWYYTEIKDRIDHDFLTLTYLDNESLDKSIVASIESKKNKKWWWKVYGLGELGELEEKIYNNWQIVDDIPHEARYEGSGIDFGFTNDPTVIEDIYSYNGGFIIDEVCYQKGLSNKSIADILLTKPSNCVHIADSSEPKSIDEIKNYGVNIIGAVKGAGSVLFGIQFVQDQRISITSRSVKTIKAYRSYFFTKDNQGKVTNEPDDTVHEWSNPMDAVRYKLAGFKARKDDTKELQAITINRRVYGNSKDY